MKRIAAAALAAAMIVTPMPAYAEQHVPVPTLDYPATMIGPAVARNEQALYLCVGQTKNIAEVLPEGSMKDYVKWTSTDTSAIEIDDNGLVTAIAETEGTDVFGTSPGLVLYVKCVVSSGGIVSTKVFEDKTAELPAGAQLDVYGTWFPGSSRAGLIWETSDPAVATVTQDGVIRAVAPGTCLVQATAGPGSMIPSGLKGNIYVTVKDMKAPVVEDGSKVRVAKGFTIDLADYLLRPYTPKDMKWTSSDTNVATVDQAGKLKAKKKGECVLTAVTADGEFGTLRVTVWQPVTQVKLEVPKDYLAIGKTMTVKANILPKSETGTGLKWSSSNKNVAAVSQKGVVKAIGKGTCTITATAKDGSGQKASVKVKVGAPVSRITLEKTSLSLFKGRYATIGVKAVTPSTAGRKTLKWTTSDASVAKVSQQGDVKGVGKGTCVITATAKDGSGVKATCKVEVRQCIENISLNAGTITVKKGKIRQLRATVAPASANNKAVTWKSNNKRRWPL